MDSSDLNLIDRIAKNNPLLCNRTRITVGDIYFKTCGGSVDDDTLKVDIDDMYRKNINALVFVLDDGYAVVDVGWLMEPETPRLELDVLGRCVYIPMGMCEVKKNDEGITRQSELPF